MANGGRVLNVQPATGRGTRSTLRAAASPKKPVLLKAEYDFENGSPARRRTIGRREVVGEA